MKLLVFISILILFFTPTSQHSKDTYAIYKIIYTFEMNQSDSFDEIRLDFQEATRIAQEKLKKMEATLIFNRTYSIFKSPPSYPMEDHSDIIVFATTRPDETYFYDSDQDILILDQIRFGVKSRMNYIQELEWEITNETAIINGILCKKAYATQRVEGFNDGKFTAWFAPDIPFPFGPRKLNGLPGVILKYNYGGFVVRAKSIKRIDDRKEKIDFPDFKGAPSFSETVR